MIRTASVFSKRAFQPRPVSRLRATYATKGTEWRKHQLDKLKNKFQPPREITNDEDLQPMWKEMESRVTKRKTLTKEQAGGKIGRRNVRKTDEEAWLQAGLYHDSDDDDDGESGTKDDTK